MAVLIFNKDLFKMIEDADTAEKAKVLAEKIVEECEAWRRINHENGMREGRANLQNELRILLNVAEYEEDEFFE